MRRLTVCFIASFFLFTTPAQAHYAGHDRTVPLKAAKNVSRVVHHWFGRDAHDAQRVVSCESKYDRRARNGTHLGVFQMGDYERHTYGHGAKVWWQVRGAYRYFVAGGRDWEAWTCKP